MERREVAFLGFWSQLTGKDVSTKVEEYSEVYGQVLLGMHQKLESLDRDLAAYKKLKQDLLDAESIKENAKHHYEKTKYLYQEIKQNYLDITKVLDDFEKSLDRLNSEVQQEFASLRESMDDRTNELKNKMSLIQQQLDKKVQDLDERTISLQKELEQIIDHINKKETLWELKIKKRDHLTIAGFALLLLLTLWLLFT
jgi:chromosome segregation ATPase